MIIKADFERNNFIGLFAKASDKYVIIPPNSPKKFEEKIKFLDVEIIKTYIGESYLLGLYCVLNSKGIILPSFCTKNELEVFESLDLNIGILDDDRFCAIGNNIAANDHGAILNPHLPNKYIKLVEETLELKAKKLYLGKYSNPGFLVVPTNKGFVAYNDISQKNLDDLKQIFATSGSNSTVNLGSPIVGLGIIANSNHALIGQNSTGVESAKIAEILDIV